MKQASGIFGAWERLQGWAERRKPTQAPAAVGLPAALLAAGFDDVAYRAENPDLAALDRDACATHYHHHGRSEGRRGHFSRPVADIAASLGRLTLRDADRILLHEDLLAAASRRLDRFGEDPAGLAELLDAASAHRPFVVLGDSHGHFYLAEDVFRSSGLLPVPYLCTGASARGLANPNSRAGYGPRILRFLDSWRDRLDGRVVLLKFGQVDLEFVHDFRRIRDGQSAFNLASAEAFAVDCAERYLSFVAAAQARSSARLVVTSAFPPVLKDSDLRAGYLNAHITELHADQDYEKTAAALASLEMPDHVTRTHLARIYNATLFKGCARAGLACFDDFTPMLGADGLIGADFVEPHGGDHHMAIHRPASRKAAADLARAACEAALVGR